jgi:hypothetical protein
MEDPAHPNYPQNLLSVVGPRNMVHSWATDKDDRTEMPRWGKIGKQRIEDAGTLYPKRMETVDDEIRDLAINFMDKAKRDNKPFFVWLNPTLRRWRKGWSRRNQLPKVLASNRMISTVGGLYRSPASHCELCFQSRCEAEVQIVLLLLVHAGAESAQPGARR